MNAIDLLTQQHRGMEALLASLLDAELSKRKRFADVADALMSHVLVEEQHFYPAVRAKRTEEILLESLEEHLSLKRLVADLLELGPSAPTFEAKLHVLEEQAKHHHEEEEEKLFPKVKKLLSSDELNALGEVMMAAQADLLADEPRTQAAEQTQEAARLTDT